MSILDSSQLFSALRPHAKRAIVTPTLIVLSIILIFVLGTIGFLEVLANLQLYTHP
jgi:hypothetical protein